MKRKAFDFQSWALPEKFEIKEFHHVGLKGWSRERRARFNAELKNICQDFQAIGTIEGGRPDNETIRDSLMSIDGHVKALMTFAGGDYFAEILAEHAETETETDSVIRFHRDLEVIRRLCVTAIKTKSYKLRTTKAALPGSIAAATGALLAKYGIKPVLTSGGAWEKLLLHALNALNMTATSNQVKNHMRSAKCKITEKRGDKLH